VQWEAQADSTARTRIVFAITVLLLMIFALRRGGIVSVIAVQAVSVSTEIVKRRYQKEFSI
jgi:hypothetical protein